MALSLTCDCGARFEVDDTLAGQEVTCPECQHPLRAPARASAPPRTSVYALASVVLALVGAFTVVGTVAAVVLGVLALVQIARQRDRLTGVGFASFGIVAGLAFTALTLFALSSSELFGVGSWVREKTLAGQVDTSGPLDISTGGFTLSRPSEKWGRVKGDRSEEPAVEPLQKDCSLVLMNVSRYAYVDVKVDQSGLGLAQIKQELLSDLTTAANPFDDEDFGPGRKERRTVPAKVLSNRSQLDTLPGYRGEEMVVEVRRGGQMWRFLVRLYVRQGDEFGAKGPVYVVRGYTPARRFATNEADLRKAVDSFRVKER